MTSALCQVGAAALALALAATGARPADPDLTAFAWSGYEGLSFH